jgi:hypothetical protein
MLSREGKIIGYSDCTLTVISTMLICKAHMGLTHPGAEIKAAEIRRKRRDILSIAIKRFVFREAA